MQTTDEIPRTYEEAERLLARWQGEGGPADLLAFAFSDPADETVRLLYVSEEFPESGAIYAMTFGRSPEIPFRKCGSKSKPGNCCFHRAGNWHASDRSGRDAEGSALAAGAQRLCGIRILVKF
jgi:hypothetical protein